MEGAERIMIRIRLSTLLGERRINQATLSRATGIRPTTINEMYRELSDRISLEHLYKICIALDCTITDILELEVKDDVDVEKLVK